jgi:IS605 OrfB family transposase
MTIRVYKYGLVPIGYPPKEAIDELFRANKLWNNLVALHRENSEKWDDARRTESINYSNKLDELAAKDKEVSEAFDVLRQVRMDEGTKDESNPKLKVERSVINRLKNERSEIYAELKLLRKDADTKIDKKVLNDAYREQCNSAVSVKSSAIYSSTADQVFANFRTARDKAFKDPKSTLQFHAFDGTGYFNFRCRKKDKSVVTDGISVQDFLNKNFAEYMRCAVQSVDETSKKTRVRISAVLTGGATKASKVSHDFDLIYHRPLPPDCQIQNGKILRTRVGDKFKYDLVLTIKVPDTEVIKPSALKGTIGIDIGFRSVGDTVLVATIMHDDPSLPPLEVKAPPEMTSALLHVIELQSELDDAATDLGKAITPLLLAKPFPEDHPKFRMWQSIAKRPAFVTLSYEKAYKFAVLLNYEPTMFSKDITEKVHTWWKSYSRKYREVHNRRRKQLLYRKHFYRQVAYDLVSHRKLITLEKIDLSRFAETKDKDTKLSNKARAQRFLGAVSELRDAIKNAADREGVPYIEVNPAYTSKNCSACDVINKALRSEKKWTCPSCGVVHDRDVNAASNLANMGKIYLSNLEKLKMKVLE